MPEVERSSRHPFGEAGRIADRLAGREFERLPPSGAPRRHVGHVVGPVEARQQLLGEPPEVPGGRVRSPGQRPELRSLRAVAPEGDQVQFHRLARAGADDEQEVAKTPRRAAAVAAAPFTGHERPQDAPDLGDWQPRTGELQEEHAPGLAGGDRPHLAQTPQGTDAAGRYSEFLRVPVVGEGLEIVLVEVVGVEGPAPLVTEVLEHLRERTDAAQRLNRAGAFDAHRPTSMQNAAPSAPLLR